MLHISFVNNVIQLQNLHEEKKLLQLHLVNIDSEKISASKKGIKTTLLRHRLK